MSEDKYHIELHDVDGNKKTSEKGESVIDTHEKFMRKASKQMVENLKEIKKDVHAISSWVMFFGIMAILGAVLAGCNLILSL
ncbi:MAG: hypothetical protein ACTSQ8_26805 [Candidatus Helarchaeota archaeon]